MARENLREIVQEQNFPEITAKKAKLKMKEFVQGIHLS
jgi:hypothetical protein